MKKILTTIVIMSVLLISMGFVFAAKSIPFTVDHNQAQDQWRGTSVFGAWTPGYSYLESATSTEFELTGNVLHTSWDYSPVVTDLEGESTVYVYNKKSGLWIEKEGTVSYGYIPGYGDYLVVNYFRGYVDFGGETPSETTFEKGVAYQWVYLYAPEDAVLSGSYTSEAVWDETMGAHLVGFSIYRWSPVGDPPAALTFPDPFPELAPANNYNPLGI